MGPADRAAERAPAPGAYRAGDEGRQVGQGEGLATAAHPLQRQSTGRWPSDGKCRQEDGGGGRSDLEHPAEESSSSTRAEGARLSTATPSAHLHPEVEWQNAPARHPHDEGQSHASAPPAGCRPRRGDQSGPKLVRVSAAAVLRRCHRAMLPGIANRQRAVDSGRRHPKLLRQDQPRGWLLDHVPMDKTVLRKWRAAGCMEKHVFHETTEGTPQGGIASPALANYALDGLEHLLREKYPKKKAFPSPGPKPVLGVPIPTLSGASPVTNPVSPRRCGRSPSSRYRSSASGLARA
jgi:hypothetical protein